MIEYSGNWYTSVFERKMGNKSSHLPCQITNDEFIIYTNLLNNVKKTCNSKYFENENHHDCYKACYDLDKKHIDISSKMNLNAKECLNDKLNIWKKDQKASY
jgi:hypothetical protein